jgi:hypothetical protein
MKKFLALLTLAAFTGTTGAFAGSIIVSGSGSSSQGSQSAPPGSIILTGKPASAGEKKDNDNQKKFGTVSKSDSDQEPIHVPASPTGEVNASGT